MNCENTFSDRTCDVLFGHNKAENQERVSSGKPPIANENCDNPSMKDHALKCAKNCFLCCERPEFNCKNPRTSANFNCDEKFTNVEILTCGLCNYKRPTNGECRDVDEFCQDKDISLLCTHEILEGRMAKLCPKTCNKCDKLQSKDSTE
uniref:ShKT domain-containing protein n=1 Tax=Ditylenchus dipsaci TaxID=166011 RepID=A0A915E3C7_9BILA